jgi:flagellar hook-associated protein 3 FlgL
MRIGTANSYALALDQLYRRQSDLVGQQEKLSSSLNVNRASDDPTGMAQAERVQAHLKRVETDQRALELQRNAITTAESALGDGVDRLQDVRDLVLAAGNAAHSEEGRATMALQMRNLRDQLFSIANRTDSNGVALFGGLGSTATPFADQIGTVDFQGTPGQRSATTSNLPGAMDGQAIWMNVRSGNGTFEVGLSATNTGTAWTDPGTVVSPAAITGNNYSISFSVVNGVTTYDVTDTTLGTAVATGQPYVPGGTIQFDGMAIVVNGTPANGDTVGVAPSTQSNVFEVLDQAIAAIDSAKGDNRLSQAVALSLVEIDASLERLQSARSQAGDWLNRADSITDAHSARTIQLNADRARAVELDPVKGISDFTTMQTAYQTALQSYASIQKLTLFNFIN